MEGFSGWEGAVLVFTGLALLLGRAFGADFWRFVENIKGTGLIPSGYTGLVANFLGVVFFGLVGVGIGAISGTSLVSSLLAGALVGFVISLRANEYADEHKASRQEGMVQLPPAPPSPANINGVQYPMVKGSPQR